VTPETPSTRFSSWRQRLFAWSLDRLTGKYEKAIAARKQELFEGISGTVVEIGPGTGANLPYLPRGVRWIGIEPNPYMHGYLERRARSLAVPVEVLRGAAERLPLPDASADVVIATLVLCSVADLPAALAEIVRVLRPAGRFLFIEHVAAPPGTRLRKLQRWVKPLWKRLGDGCEPDRETWCALERAGFSQLAYSRFAAPVPLVSPQIIGSAVK
jgi:ubiquinone/menaquinone biosynthesis C-methylase UbiE